jgi:hypothetical protein
MMSPNAVAHDRRTSALKEAAERINPRPKMRPQSPTNAKLAQLMVRTTYFPDADSLESAVREFESALRVEREGFRPDEDSSEKKELFITHANSPEYSCTTDDGILIKRKFCAHHDSPHYGPLIVNFWNDIRVVITKASEMLKWIWPEEKDTPIGGRIFKFGVDGILAVIGTGFMNVWDEDNYEMKLPKAEWKLYLQTVPAHTFCPGCQVSWFCSDRPGWCKVGAITIAALLCGARNLYAWMQEIIDVRYMTTAWNGEGFYYPFNHYESYNIFKEMERWASPISRESVDSFVAFGNKFYEIESEE